MPDVFQKDHPHRPVVTVTGHFSGMHVPEQPSAWKPDQLWYRGDDYAALQRRLTEAQARVDALVAQLARESTEVPRRLGKR